MITFQNPMYMLPATMLTGHNNRPYLKGGHVFPFPSAKVKGQINVHFSLRSQQQRVWWIHHESTVNQEKALCLHCQLISCFSDFFWLCDKSLLSCESISTHCLAPRETVRVQGSRDNVSPRGVNEFCLVARNMFFVQSENALKLGDVTVFCTFTGEFIDLFVLAF